MQTADKRPRLFERSEFLGRPPCILLALDRLACGIGHPPTRAGFGEWHWVRIPSVLDI